MARAKVVRLQGQPKKRYYNDNGKSVRKPEDNPDASALMVGGAWGHSKFWQLRLDECDKFSDVKVYDGEGNLVRVIPRPELTRPMPVRAGQSWNNYLFLDVKDK